MRKLIYNLEFPSWCPTFSVHGYFFSRVEKYSEQVLRLQHLGAKQTEFQFPATMGENTITAYVDTPDHEEAAALEWESTKATGLDDLLLLLSLFTGRDVFKAENQRTDGVYSADPRQYRGGGVLRASIPYKPSSTTQSSGGQPYDIGFENEINRIYALLRNNEWHERYARGYYLFLMQQASYEQTIESAFTQCWTIWEHLFAILNQKWLSPKQMQQLDSSDKIAFILTEFALRGEVDATSKQRIKTLAEIRNRIIHFGKLPERESVFADAVFFVRLTEFVVAKTLGLEPSNVFSTVERLEQFLTGLAKGER